MSDRIDELGERARWFLGQFDEIDLADLCASEETAMVKAQAAISRVRQLAAAQQAEGVDGVPCDADTLWPSEVLAALDEPTDTAEEDELAAAYARTINTPPSAETCAAIRARLESGDYPRRTVHPRPSGALVATEATEPAAIAHDLTAALRERRPTSSDSPDTLRRLRAWLASEYDKADAADRATDVPPELMIRPHNGIAAGIAIALHAVDCMLGTQPEEQP